MKWGKRTVERSHKYQALGIPDEHFELVNTIDDLKKYISPEDAQKMIFDYVSNIGKAIKAGLSLFVYGLSGYKDLIKNEAYIAAVDFENKLLNWDTIIENVILIADIFLDLTALE